MLESGGYKADDEARDLYRGENVGVPYEFADGCRSRFSAAAATAGAAGAVRSIRWDFEKRALGEG